MAYWDPLFKIECHAPAQKLQYSAAAPPAASASTSASASATADHKDSGLTAVSVAASWSATSATAAATAAVPTSQTPDATTPAAPAPPALRTVPTIVIDDESDEGSGAHVPSAPPASAPPAVVKPVARRAKERVGEGARAASPSAGAIPDDTDDIPHSVAHLVVASTAKKSARAIADRSVFYLVGAKPFHSAPLMPGTQTMGAWRWPFGRRLNIFCFVAINAVQKVGLCSIPAFIAGTLVSAIRLGPPPRKGEAAAKS